MTRNLPRWLALATVVLALAAFAKAEPKPNPEPIDQVRADEPDLDLFRAAYARAGEPAILVLAGLDSHRVGQSITQERAATGLLPPEQYIGHRLSLLDPAGDAAKFKGDLEEVLLNAGADLVSLDALSERDRREIAILQDRSERRAVNLLAKKVNADVVVLVRMIDSPKVREKGVKYRSMVELLDVERGHKVGGFTFDWTLGTDAYTIKDYARAVARKTIEQFAALYAPAARGTARRYAVRLFGAPEARDVAEFLEALAEQPGVSRVKDGGFTSDQRETVATFSLNYAGPLLDLVSVMQDLGRDQMGMWLETADAQPGALTLVARGAPAGGGPLTYLPEESRWRSLVNADEPDFDESRAAFRQAYKAAGAPKVGLIINRGALERDREYRLRLGRDGERLGAATRPADLHVGSADSLVVYSPTFITGGRDVNVEHDARERRHDTDDRERRRPGDRRGPWEEALFNHRRMEDLIYKQLMDVGVTAVDPDFIRRQLDPAVRERLALRGEVVGDRLILEEDELEALLTKEAKAAGLDVLIVGVGRLVETQRRTGGGSRDLREAAPEVRYTFRAIRVSDGVLLGAETISEGLDEPDAPAPDASLSEIARYAAGNLLDQMWAFWEQQTPATQPAR